MFEGPERFDHAYVSGKDNGGLLMFSRGTYIRRFVIRYVSDDVQLPSTGAGSRGYFPPAPFMETVADGVSVNILSFPGSKNEGDICLSWPPTMSLMHNCAVTALRCS